MTAMLPLTGIKVADFSWFGAGPICAQNLARYGATVVRVESQAHIDGLRSVMPFATGKSGYNVSGYFNNYNAGKLGITINMSSEKGREIGGRLVQWCDVFITNQTPRIVEKWGFTYGELVKLNPTIIAAYQPMQGADGPHKDFLGFGAVLNAITGYNELSGFPHRTPFGLGTNYPDYVINPGHTLIAILAALRHRRKTGEGQKVELAQIESAVASLAPAVMDYAANGRVQTRAGNRIPNAAPHGAFRCADTATETADERWVAFGIFDDEQWQSLVHAMGNPAWADAKFATLADRKQREDELETLISEWTRTQTAPGVMALLQSKGIPAGIVHNSRDVLDNDPHLRERAYYEYIEHPETGRMAHDGQPFRLSKAPDAGLHTPAPLLGELDDRVLKDILGLTDDEIGEALAEQALY